MSQYDPNEVLFGSGVPSFQFDSFGATCQGVITEVKATQQTDFNDGSPKFWPNGDPMLQVVVTVQTKERDPSVEDDDGKRNVFVKGKSMTDAVRQAVKGAGQKKLEPGSLLTVTYTGDGPKERGKNPPKLYEASYVKPGPGGQAAPVQQQLTKTVDPSQDPAYQAFLAAQQGAVNTAPTPVAQPVSAGQEPVEGTVEDGNDPLAALDPRARKLVERMMADKAASQQ